MGGTKGGMQFVIDDATAIYGDKTQTIPGSNRMRWRYYLDPNGVTMANGDKFSTLNVHTTTGGILNLILFQLQFTSGTGYQLVVRSKNDSGANTDNTVNLADAPHYIECDYVRAATNVSADGSYRVWVDGVLEITETSIDNFDHFGNMSNVRVGVSARDGGTSGTIFIDEITANDDGAEIGPALRAVRAMHHHGMRAA